ncbi:MAG TPA: Ig-like domain-containing protein [Puia sp.]|nr:Ig-like domain-containing protein [Puia sp.]
MKKNLLRFLVSLCCILLLGGQANPLFAQDPAQYGTPFTGVPDPRDVTIYQVNMRAFSSTHNLQGVINRLDQIKALGTNVVYLMPVYPVGVLKSVNSPYCIRNFDSVGTEFGTLTDLRNLVDGAHSRGMAVMMDWVVNQTSYDHPWITQHPDWYLKDGSGNITGLNGYTDVAALDFTQTAMRTAMITQMRYWVFAANVDGFRCDFADNPPIDFWQQTITSLRGITTHKLLLLAEGTRAANYTAGFDYNFGMQFYYNSLKPIFSGGAATAIDNSNTVEYASATGNQQIVRYLTNHDVDGSDGAPVTLFGGKTGSMAAFVVAAYMKGVPFVYNGTEVAFPTPITFPFTSVTIDWTINPDVTAEYTKVIGFRNSSTAIRRGTLVSYTNNDVCAFTKTSGTEQVVVFSNLRNATTNYTLPAALANTNWKDAYSGATVSLGTSLSLTAYQYRVLTNANVPPVTVTGVTMSPTSVSIPAGLTSQLTATIAPANATNQAVTWTSGNTAVATVSASGLVTAVAAGTATITVTTADQAKTATAAITVTSSTNFTVYFYPPTGWGTGIKIYWWSALPAGVLADGTWPGVNMTAAGSGWYSYTFTNVTSTNLIFNDGSNQTANLSRSSTGWYLNGTWYNTNPGTPVAVTGVTLSPATATVNVGATQQLTATVAPSNATNQAVSWTSGNTGVATVSTTGLVTAVAGGTTTITVTTQDGSKTATAAITVPSAGTTWYQIINRWQPNTYLYDGGNGQVKYGTTPGTSTLYQWAQVNLGNGYIQLQNRSTGNFMHVENQNGAVQAGAIQSSWYSAMWTIAATGDGWNYIENRWQTNQWIHIENLLGYAQYSGAQTGWYSAMWNFVNPVTGTAATPALQTGTALNLADGQQTGLIKLYPNPAPGGQFYLSVPGLVSNEPASVTIRDSNGKLLLTKTITGSAQLEQHLAAGLYFITVQSKRLNETKKLLVQ